MKAIIEKWIINTAISFIIRQVVQFEAKTDFGKVKEDLAIRIADLVPGDFLDQDAVLLMNTLVDACERALETSKSLEAILLLAADKKYSEASERLRAYLAKSWRPEAEVANRAKSYVETYSFV